MLKFEDKVIMVVITIAIGMAILVHESNEQKSIDIYEAEKN